MSRSIRSCRRRYAHFRCRHGSVKAVSADGIDDDDYMSGHSPQPVGTPRRGNNVNEGADVEVQRPRNTHSETTLPLAALSPSPSLPSWLSYHSSSAAPPPRPPLAASLIECSRHPVKLTSWRTWFHDYGWDWDWDWDGDIPNLLLFDLEVAPRRRKGSNGDAGFKNRTGTATAPAQVSDKSNEWS